VTIEGADELTTNSISLSVVRRMVVISSRNFSKLLRKS
jgi:hypothetical protein